jgi:diaminopimelate decarboxylase
MDFFHYKDGILYCEDVALPKIADKAGTPCYVYSYETLKRHFKVFDGSFKEFKHLTCFSVKANSNLSILKIFKELGSGFDIVSGGELFRVLKVGVEPSKVVYSGVGKREDEIEFALKSGILMFNVESFAELHKINEVAARLKINAPVALRVNPNVDPKTHPYISTGLKKNKFGINIDSAIDWYKTAKELEHIEIVGVDCHIGSQLTEISPFVDALTKIKGLIKSLEEMNIEIKYLDIGGGLGVTYSDETPPSPLEYADAVTEALKGLNVTLITEPGRVLVANAGVLLTKVIYNKSGDIKNFVIVDAAMNDLIRPSLYEAYQDIVPVVRKDGSVKKVDIVGPICESGDFLGQDRNIRELDSGELLVVKSAGAYGFTMASNYNSRPRPAEILVRGNEFSIIRERETFEDLIKGEVY